MMYRGKAQDFRMRIALADAGDMMIELIQPLSDNNIYVEHLQRKGEGLHHVGMFVPSFDQAVTEAKRQGFSVLQSGRGYGRLGDGGVRVPRHQGPPGAHPRIDRGAARADSP